MATAVNPGVFDERPGAEPQILKKLAHMGLLTAPRGRKFR